MTFLFINVNHDVGYDSSESIPLSMGYLLAGLKARGWNGVILDDLKDRVLRFKHLEKWIRRINPSVVGLTAYQSTMHRVRFLCRYVKSRHPRIQTVLGGPQVVSMPSAALEDLRDVDALVRGEGEVVILEMARALSEGRCLHEVGDLTVRDGDRIVDTGDGPETPSDLDAYPSPYLSNVLNLQGKNTAILLSSRGCRHVCKFCITPRICGGTIRYHSVDRVLAEMELLSGQGIERFWFADPNFTDDRERTLHLLEEKIRRGITTPFWCQTRSDLVDGELLRHLKRAGADTIAFGLESGSPGVLKSTGKGIELTQLREQIQLVQSLDMEAELFSIFGLPGETVEDARATLEFVRSLGIPIQSNSGSQQMQLYFGSIYERNPRRFGIRPLDGYRARYVSVGDQYETAKMSRSHVRKVRNMWALANEQMQMDVYYKQRVFEILDFLLENREDLREIPAFHAYGALACAAIEEHALLEGFLDGYRQAATEDDAPVEELISSLGFFQESDEPAGPMDRVIFDSRSYMDGIPFTGISGRYWDVLLGRGLLLPDFEAGFVGAVAGQECRFAFTFPDDYVQQELGGKTVEVQVRIHKVFKCLAARTMADVRALKIRNSYPFTDLDFLREQNDILYYLALRNTDPERLLRSPSHFLMLVLRFSKLGKKDRIKRLATLVADKPTALNALADTLAGTGKYAWALEYYESLSGDLPSAVLKRARCLLQLERPREALALLETLEESPTLEFQETLLECLKAASPSSQRLPDLEYHVIDLRVKAALVREGLPRGGGFAEPIVHGDT